MFSSLQDRMAQAAGQAAANEATKYAGEQVSLRWEQCKYMSTIRTVVGIIYVIGKCLPLMTDGNHRKSVKSERAQ